MGQRLVVTLFEDGDPVASIYYHWSAFFRTTINELGLLSEDILNAEKNGEDPLYGIMKGLEERGGGIRGGSNPEYTQEIKAARKLFPNHQFKEDISRDAGIITFTEEGMKSFASWGEGFAAINISTHEIRNGVSYEGEEYLDYDYKDLGNAGVLQSPKDGTVHNGNGETCSVNAFNLTCETIFELGKFIGLFK